MSNYTEVRRLKEDMRNQASRHDQERCEQEDKHECELRTFREEQERKDQENRCTIESIRAEHTATFKAEQERHYHEDHIREEKYKRELDEFAALMKQNIDEVNMAHESTRLTKDAEIRQLHIQIETQRSQYDVQFNKVKIAIET